jgi:ketosteroid isomerase-like protein
MRRRVSPFAMAALVVLAIATVSAGDDAADLKARAEAWEKAFNASKVEEVAAMYAQDGMRMPPNAVVAKGRDAILAQLRESRKMMSGVEIEEGEVIVEGTLAVTHGTYRIKGLDGAVVDNGKWVSIGRKVNGKWTTVFDIWNSDRPLPAR